MDAATVVAKAMGTGIVAIGTYPVFPAVSVGTHAVTAGIKRVMLVSILFIDRINGLSCMHFGKFCSAAGIAYIVSEAIVCIDIAVRLCSMSLT